MRVNRRWPSPTMAIAIAALFFALGGGAVAAGHHYVITSTKQMKPSVLKQLKGAKGPRGVRGAQGAQGAQGVQGAQGAQGPAGPLVTPEAWREVGAAGEPAFINGWANNSDTGDTTTAFYKDPFEIVHLKGTVGDAVTSGGATDVGAFVLPSGYRPTKTACFPTISVLSGAGTIAATPVCVESNGTVDIGTLASGNHDYLLDGITFRAGTG